MNRVAAMTQLGDSLGVGPIPDSITGIVAALGGTRATAGLLGVDLTDKSDAGKRHIASTQRTLQRYMKAEKGETGKNVRGQSVEKRSALTGDLRAALAEREKKAAEAKHPRGFHAKVQGNFFLSYAQKGRAVKPVYIPRDDMEAIIDQIQAGDYKAAASVFDDAYGNSYDVPGMRWGEDANDRDAYDSLSIY